MTRGGRKGTMRCVAAAAAAALLLGMACAREGRAQALVADLSSHLVAITTGFVGTDVLLFGATDGPGDVIVVVRGPNRHQVVRRKSRIAGIWVNDAEFSFRDVPSFYAVASSKPLDMLLAEPARTRHRIGLANLRLVPEGEGDPETIADFRAGLIRANVRAGLYVPHPDTVTFLGERLFRANVTFPANVPTGSYTVEVFLVRDGGVVSAQTSPLLIAKIGFGAEIYQFARRHAALYGILAIVIALSAGWAAGTIFRKA